MKLLVTGGSGFIGTNFIKYILTTHHRSIQNAINSDKAKKNLGWRPVYDFEYALKRTVKWYLEHQDWWKRIKSGAYQEYYQKWYGRVLGS